LFEKVRKSNSNSLQSLTYITGTFVAANSNNQSLLRKHNASKRSNANSSTSLRQSPKPKTAAAPVISPKPAGAISISRKNSSMSIGS
jgi:hypothetical protein